MPDPAEVLKDALSLDVHDRAALAQRLLASLDELSEEEAERLWAEEAQRRREDYHAARARAVPAGEVAKRAAKLFRLSPSGTTRLPTDELLNQIAYLEILAVPALMLVP